MTETIQNTDDNLSERIYGALHKKKSHAMYPEIKVIIGSGRNKNGTMSGGQPNYFSGPDAPKKAVRFLRSKFPMQAGDP